MASVLASPASVLTGFLLLATTPALAHHDRSGAVPDGAKTIEVQGRVELTAVAAMRSAEAAARSAILERFGPSWRAERSFVVPEARVETLLDRFLSRRVRDGAGIAADPVQELPTSAGLGYRQSFTIDFGSRATKELLRRGTWRIRALNEQFTFRYAGIAGLWVLLTLIGVGINRATRGWLTGRIALATVGLGAIGTWTLLPQVSWI